jgi:CoA:oxalate CoA-transferase
VYRAEQENVMSPTSPPLAGLRILDFSRVLAGPFATALLSDLGAEVIKIEPPAGDDYRQVGPMRDGHSALFCALNRNKKSVVLDLKDPQCIEAVRELARASDVVLENFRPGVAEKLGIGPSQLMECNPRLVYISISGFGQSGPWSHRPAYDIVVQALSGLMEATGNPDGPPTLVGESVADVVSGMFASWAALAALLHVQRTGKGQHVDVAMLDSMLALLTTAAARYHFTGIPARRVGNRHPLSAPFGVYQASDGHFVVAVLNNRLFEAAAGVIGRADLAADPGLQTDWERSAREPELREAIEQWSAGRTVDQVLEALERAGVPCAPIWDIGRALESRQVGDRGFVHRVENDELPGLKVVTQPVRFGGFAAVEPQRAPRLGEHTADVLAGVAGQAKQRAWPGKPD